jgi:hypothetical protein
MGSFTPIEGQIIASPPLAFLVQLLQKKTKYGDKKNKKIKRQRNIKHYLIIYIIKYVIIPVKIF